MFPLYKVIRNSHTFQAKVLLYKYSVCGVCFLERGRFLCLSIFFFLSVYSFYLFCISLRLRGDTEDGSGPLQCCFQQGICDWQWLHIPGTLVCISFRHQNEKPGCVDVILPVPPWDLQKEFVHMIILDSKYNTFMKMQSVINVYAYREAVHVPTWELLLSNRRESKRRERGVWLCLGVFSNELQRCMSVSVWTLFASTKNLEYFKAIVMLKDNVFIGKHTLTDGFGLERRHVASHALDW